MAEEHKESVEVSDRGLFDFMKKEEAKKSEVDVVVTGVEKLSVEESGEKKEQEAEKEKEGLLHKLHRSRSSSSSSSSEEEVEEVGPDGEKIKTKKKKGLKEKIKEKFGGGHDKKELEAAEVTSAIKTEQDVVVVAAAAANQPEAVVVEKIGETVKIEAVPEGEKKGFLEKIKEKLPGHGHKRETVEVAATDGGEGHEGKEKKGILGKIMEKLPGYHKEEKEGH